MIRAVVFDMDGVLLDARELHHIALNKALNLFGDEISREEHEDKYDGLPTKVKLNELTLLGRIRVEDHNEISRQKQLFTKKLLKEFIHPNPNHLILLESLLEKNYKMGLASNSIRETVDVAMELTGVGKFMDFTLSTNDVEKPKPDPEIYRTAIAILGVDANEVLVIEDNQKGVVSANGAGAHVMQVRSVDEVSKEAVFKRINEINLEKPGGL